MHAKLFVGVLGHTVIFQKDRRELEDNIGGCVCALSLYNMLHEGHPIYITEKLHRMNDLKCKWIQK